MVAYIDVGVVVCANVSVVLYEHMNVVVICSEVLCVRTDRVMYTFSAYACGVLVYMLTCGVGAYMHFGIYGCAYVYVHLCICMCLW